MCFFRGEQQKRRGATIVEFALFFIIFLMLTFGLMEFGMAVWTYNSITHAARAGARYAIVHGATNPIPDDGITVTDVVRRNAVGLVNSNLTVTTSFDTGTPGDAATNEKGRVVQVQVDYPFQLITGGLVLPGRTLNLRSTARMVIAN